MKRIIAMLTVAGLLFCSWPAEIQAAEGNDAKTTETASDAKASDKAGNTAEASAAKDNIVTTKHSAVIQGKTIPYTAETGTMVLTSGGVDCEIFYVAYTRDDVENIKDRPVTFAFNGGPGFSNFYIQFGCMGPRRSDIDENGFAKTFPPKIVDNGNSILDMTDLVFIDPVGTGYSRALNEEETNEFYSYDGDRRSVGDFIRKYINRHKRWGSPKYIAGESYGTTRSVGVCEYLSQQYYMYVNGLMLISCANDFYAITNMAANDLAYVNFVPTFAANAWYHGKLSKEYQDKELEDYLDEVRDFVESELQPALFLGKKLQKERKEALAEKLSGYLGVSKDFVLEQNLRITVDGFNRELLKDKKLVIGRYDGRMTGPSVDGDLGDSAADPSDGLTDMALAETYLDYVTSELGFETDRPFIPFSIDINYAWIYEGDSLPVQEETIYNCMSINPYLKVWALCGYYDGATPFYATEWTYNHIFLSEERENNLQLTYYPSGHMLYMEKNSFDKFRKDAEKWYK